MNRHEWGAAIAAGWLAYAALGCTKLTESPNVGTNTNWLKSCSKQADCGDGRSCLCGVCTRSCASDRQCGVVHEATRCEALTDTACGAGSGISACLQGCDSNADCTALEHGLCREGLCVPASIEVDAAAPGRDAGTEATDSGEPDAGSPDDRDASTAPMQIGFSLSRDDTGTVAIHDAYTACSTHVDCMLVSTSCNGCCEQSAIASNLRETYEQNFEAACASYQGPECDCMPRDLVPRCDADHCRGVERASLECYSPNANIERVYDPELVGCSCDRPDVQICFKTSVGDVALACTRDLGSAYAVWRFVIDGPCAPQDRTCAQGTVLPEADACLADFSFCYPLESGEYCGR